MCSQEYSIISNVYKDDAAVLSNIPSYTVPKGYIGIVIYIKVVNPSPSDIGRQVNRMLQNSTRL